MTDYYDKKDDEGKQEALFPVELIAEIQKKESVFAVMMFEINSKLNNIIGNVEEVLQFGAKKYTPNSWQTVEDAEKRYWSAFVRHNACRDGYMYDELADEESDLPHSWHALCNLMFLLWFEINRENISLSERISALTKSEGYATRMYSNKTK